MRKKKLKTLELEEANELVVQNYNFWLKRTLKDLSKINEKQRWLIMGRMCQFIFSQHFKLAIDCTAKIQTGSQPVEGVKR